MRDSASGPGGPPALPASLPAWPSHLSPSPPKRPGVWTGEAGAGPRFLQHPEPGAARSHKPQPRGDGPQPPAPYPRSLTYSGAPTAAAGVWDRQRREAGGRLRAASVCPDTARLRWRRPTARGGPRQGAGPAGEGRSPHLSFMQRGRGEGPGCPGSSRPPR